MPAVFSRSQRSNDKIPKESKKENRKNSLARFSLGWFIKLLAVRLHLTFCSEKSSGQTRITHVNARRWLLIDGEAHTASTWPLFSLYFFFYLTLRYFILLRMPEREREKCRGDKFREREREMETVPGRVKVWNDCTFSQPLAGGW